MVGHTVPQSKHIFVIFKVFGKPFFCIFFFPHTYSHPFFAHFGFVQENMADLWLCSFFSDQKKSKIRLKFKTTDKGKF